MQLDQARKRHDRRIDEADLVMVAAHKVGVADRTQLRTQPARQRTYIRLYARVDRLEDAISHFYNVINVLRRRVSTLEKKSKPLAKDGRTIN